MVESDPGGRSTAAYHMLKDGVPYKDLGAHHFTERNRTKTVQRLLRRLEQMGCSVQMDVESASQPA